jgi:hypothetical protein
MSGDACETREFKKKDSGYRWMLFHPSCSVWPQNHIFCFIIMGLKFFLNNHGLKVKLNLYFSKVSLLTPHFFFTPLTWKKFRKTWGWEEKLSTSQSWAYLLQGVVACRTKSKHITFYFIKETLLSKIYI